MGYLFEKLLRFFVSIPEWSFWDHFRPIVFSPVPPPSYGSIFGFSEYLASLALLLVVLTVSDFRYRYRFAITKWNMKKIGVIVAFGVGFSIIAIDIWYQNGLPTLDTLKNPNNLKAALGIILLTYLAILIWQVVVAPPKFNKWNANNIYSVIYRYIHEGNSDRLQVIAEEISPSLNEIVRKASVIKRMPRYRSGDKPQPKAPIEIVYAQRLILLFADKRFCQIIVDRIPAFALALMEEAKKYPESDIPIFQFARNIGQEFIKNTNSAFYQEDAGYHSGLLGYEKPITHVVFGSFHFVEQCASDGASQLDTEFRDIQEFDQNRMRGFTRAALAFFEDYLLSSKGRSYPHSYALTRLMSSFTSAVSSVYQLNNEENYLGANEYHRLRETTHFIKDAIIKLQEHAELPVAMKTHDRFRRNVFDEIAELIFEIIFAASAVSSPPWTAWTIQHNSVWGTIFSFDRSPAGKIIAFKVRRLLYDEIRRMDEWPNFKGARILGFCLLVLGLNPTDRRNGHGREFYPLQTVVLRWTRGNYRRLLAQNPKVAEACLMGSVTYDPRNNRLVKSFNNDTLKEPKREYLELPK